MKKIFLLIFISLFILGCNSNEKANSQFISSEEVTKIMNEKEYVIIDVRTKEEYDEKHLENAINIPYDEINSNIDISKDKTIFVYCKSGNRSNTAWNTLNNLGYTVYDLGAFESIDLTIE